jgi:hypothetical protein
MGRHGPPDQQGSPEEPPREVQLTVVSDAHASTRRYRRAGVTVVLLALAVAAVLYGGPLQRYHRPESSKADEVQPPNIRTNVLIGLDALAAEFRAALRCHTLTFAASDPAYVRAQPARTGACRQYGAAPTSIYREVNREFRLVLDTAAYSCPVRSLPRVVQAELHLCPKSMT